MDSAFILQQIQHMKPSSFSEIEQQCYRAEKMLMRQFMLMKLQGQTPIYISAEDMKQWLLAGRSFLEESEDIAKGTEAGELHAAELAWTSARSLCVDQMERELQEELEKERCLSLLLRREVTLEGLQMFLSIIRPRAEQDVRVLLRHLSNELLNSCVGSHTSKRSKLAQLAKLQRTTAPLAPQVVETTLKFLLDEPELFVETSGTQGMSSLTSALRNRAEVASAQIGEQLADAAATCFCMNTCLMKACLLSVCTSEAQVMVKAIYKRFVVRSKTFHLMDFDESFIIGREGVVCAIQDINDSMQSAAYKCSLYQLFPDEKPSTPEVSCEVAAEMTDEKMGKKEKQGMRAFFSRMWEKMTSTRE